jgi:N-acetylmuramoyl-L-alanine amidase
LENIVTDDDTATRRSPVADKDTLNDKQAGSAVLPLAPPVVFKVQIAASMRQIPKEAREFKSFPDVKEYRVGKIYKYAIGNSPTFQEILQYSKQVKEKFPDAFIIAVKEGKIIPLDQALKESQPQTTKN